MSITSISAKPNLGGLLTSSQDAPSVENGTGEMKVLENGTPDPESGPSNDKHTVQTTLAGFGAAKELQIPVPYGHIAAKEWGPPDGMPVLGLHGWQDNAGTFDLLVAHLPATIHFVAIDLPGHGLSSHLPLGAIYGPLLFLVDVKRVVNFLGWQQFSFLSHSLGAIISMYYAALHPEQVLCCVSIDILFPGVRIKSAATVRKFLDAFFVEEAKECIEEITYAHSEESALDLMWKRREGMSREGAVVLLKRGSRKTDKGLVFTRDNRLKLFLSQPWECESQEAVFTLLENISAKVLVLIASGSTIAKKPQDVQDKTKEVLTKHCKLFRCIEVQGSHFVHLVDPTVVAPFVTDFLFSAD